jgi:hypothetical protein
MILRQRYLPAMAKSVARMFLALIVAFAVAMPVSVRAIPMPTSGGNMAGMGSEQPCQKCPAQYRTGSTAPGKMLACHAVICIATPAVLPLPTQLPGRVALRADYVRPLTARLAGADPAPDPFPPRPIVLS